MALDRVDDVRAADWLSQIHVQKIIVRLQGWRYGLISGGNPFKAPNSYKKCLCLLGSTVLCRPQQQWSATKKKSIGLYFVSRHYANCLFVSCSRTQLGANSCVFSLSCQQIYLSVSLCSILFDFIS